MKYIKHFEKIYNINNYPFDVIGTTYTIDGNETTVLNILQLITEQSTIPKLARDKIINIKKYIIDDNGPVGGRSNKSVVNICFHSYKNMSGIILYFYGSKLRQWQDSGRQDSISPSDWMFTSYESEKDKYKKIDQLERMFNLKYKGDIKLENGKLVVDQLYIKTRSYNL